MARAEDVRQHEPSASALLQVTSGRIVRQRLTTERPASGCSVRGVHDSAMTLDPIALPRTLARMTRPRDTIVTTRLRLDPITEAHVDELFRIHTDPDVVAWWDGAWTRDDARRRAIDWERGWNENGVS